VNITLSATQKRFVDDQVSSGRYVDASDVVREAVRLLEVRHLASGFSRTSTLGMLQYGDGIEASALIVMMEAAKSAQEDLKGIMASVTAINTAKQEIRQTLGRMSRDLAANCSHMDTTALLDFSRGLGSERSYHTVLLPCLDPDAPGGVRYIAADFHPGPLTRKEDIAAVIADTTARLDNLSEMGEMASVRLQMAMDRRSKTMTALSNVLKRANDTASDILQNLK
jgi:Arc/MetJ-type ribon-helix-helix transcriptional regulator